ncbi:MAG: hypothetical protein CVU46_12470 [Chloroflexi bacterium HGW-Chloroflexi-8]|nr:MAG: hypothetical protein CVU46_12470 [Chloroflexi bacterium HGW-Chloroflexi-8]
MNEISSQYFTRVLLTLLDETFDGVHGYYLDRGTSLFETLSTITAAQASVPVGGKCATLAAQVKHVSFHLDSVLKWLRDGNQEPFDWGEIWRTVNVVSSVEWQEIQTELRVNYENVKALIQFSSDWNSENKIGDAMAILAHTAYHLGEIRQALCTIQ